MSSAFPALLHFAHKYAHDPAAALLASANAGGENVHRSCVLGALLGAAHGDGGLAPWLIEGLTARGEIEAEAAAFAAMVAAKRSPGGAGGAAAGL